MDLDRVGSVVIPIRSPNATGDMRSVVGRAANGDHAAFTELVAAFQPDMVRLAGVIVGDPDLARDAVQTAWQRAWTGLRGVRDSSHIRSWLLSIAANEARQILRRRRPADVVPEHLLLALPDPLDEFASDDDFDNVRLDAALSRLAARDRELLGLRYVLGFSSVELAAQIGLSPDGVRARLKRLLDRLREELTDV